MQFKVTQENETEPAYKSNLLRHLDEYYKTSTKGIYSCIVCTKPLFTSDDKFDSGCGWPAFYDELKEANIVKKVDARHGMNKT
jgi:methionine-R-sulfoxide reductase